MESRRKNLKLLKHKFIRKFSRFSKHRVLRLLDERRPNNRVAKNLSNKYSRQRTASIFRVELTLSNNQQAEPDSYCLIYSSTLKMEEIFSSGTSIIYQTTRCHIPEDRPL
jgi:hypothetical protein